MDCGVRIAVDTFRTDILAMPCQDLAFHDGRLLFVVECLCFVQADLYNRVAAMLYGCQCVIYNSGGFILNISPYIRTAEVLGAARADNRLNRQMQGVDAVFTGTCLVFEYVRVRSDYRA